jgi:hypothetical protein
MPRATWTGAHYVVLSRDGAAGVAEVRAAIMSADGVLAPGSAHLLSPDDGQTSDLASGAWSGSELAVVYADESAANTVHFARADADGALIAGSDVTIGPGVQASVAWDPADRQWAVAWRDDTTWPPPGSVRFVRVSATGAIVAGSAVYVAYGATLSDTGTALVWNPARARFAVLSLGTDAVRVSEINGTTVTTPVTIPAKPVARAALATDGAGYGVAWTNSEGTARVRFARGDASGAPPSASVVFAPSFADEPDLVWTGSEYLVVLAGDDQIVTARVDATGAIVPGSERTVSCAPSAADYPSIAWRGDGYAITYEYWPTLDSDATRWHTLVPW